MIAKLIDWCVHNRAMVLLLTAVLVGAGVWSTQHIAIDAIPDLSDVQVIVRTEYPGQAPQLVEQQVTYPLTTAMMSVPDTKVVRGYSMFGTSFVYIIFKDGTDLYWARSRVLEQLSVVGGELPTSAKPELGPDATGVGWVYEYALTTGPYLPKYPGGLWHDPDTEEWYVERAEAPGSVAQARLIHHRVFKKGATLYFDSQARRGYGSIKAAPRAVRDRLQKLKMSEPDQSLADLRSLQDWYLRYELVSVDGVSEVAPVGGFVKQYQVTVDPVKLLAYDMSLSKVKRAIKRSNADVGGRLIEQSETEFMVRGLGYLGTLSDQEIDKARAAGESVDRLRTQRVIAQLGKIALGATEDGSPVYLSNVAQVNTGPEIRRGVADWNGQGEVAGGIVIMRAGENAQAVIQRVRDKLDTLEKGLPPGVAIKTAYDRSGLIHRAVETLNHTLVEEIVIVSLICILFLLHARSALVAAFVLPVGVLVTLTTMDVAGINANIMSLGGIAIAIGVMVDSSIVMVENAHKHMEVEKERVAGGGSPRSRASLISDASCEVGPSLFFALLIIVVSFLPIFVLGGQSGRMFRPLAYTKTFAMTAGAILAVTVIPVLMVYFVSERMLPTAMARWKRWTVYVLAILGPALLLALIPWPALHAWRWWGVGGWIVLAGLVLLPQKLLPEARHPLSKLLKWAYEPLFTFVMYFRWPVILAAVVLVVATVWPFSKLGSEFMPPLNEGDLLYMPTTDPGLSITKAGEILQQTDRIIDKFPEVKTVFGKIGRADTATDPAPLSMIETIIQLRQDKQHWRRVPVHRFFSGWPDWLSGPLGYVWPTTRPITTDELIYGYDLPRPAGDPAGPSGHASGSMAGKMAGDMAGKMAGDMAGKMSGEMADKPIHIPGLNDAIQFPGLTNAWTMPIKTRIDMLSTGIKTPVGIKVMGPDLGTLAATASRIAQSLKTDPATAAYTTSAFAEKTVGGNYFDIDLNRDAITRYGLTVGDVQDVIMSAMGGMNVTTTLEGLQRYPVNVRYPRELRQDPASIKQILVATPRGDQVPLGQLATLRIHKGPPMIKSENARPTAWIFVDIAGIDVGTYVKQARQAVAKNVDLPAGYSMAWSGQYEYMQAARRRLLIAAPMAIIAIVLLLYVATRSWLQTAIVLLAEPFALVGAVWLIYLMGYDLSLAVWVGMIALAGLAAETGIVMLLYLNNSFERYRAEGRMRSSNDLWHAIHDGAVQRIRPMTMTVMAAGMGLVPLLWAHGAGADTMRRLAVPMIGGLSTAFVMELLIFPAVFFIAKRVTLRRAFQNADEADHFSTNPSKP